MTWLQAIDTTLFRFFNQSLANPAFDWLMPKLASHPLFIPLLIVAGLGLLWKGGRRGRVFVLLLALVLSLGDGLVCNTIKKTVKRPRPCRVLPDARVLIGCSRSGSLPSAHAANWFAATMVAFLFYRRSWRILLPAATAVAYSRVYDGVHYPGDVLAGAILGAGYAVAMVWAADALWRWAGRRWFPVWWAQLPSLARPEAQAAGGTGETRV
jgi:membrane-associated phospholipid phosphatase